MFKKNLVFKHNLRVSAMGESKSTFSSSKQLLKCKRVAKGALVYT